MKTSSLGQLSALIALGAMMSPALAWGQEPVCEAAAPLDAQRYLRRLSLDLTGRTPEWSQIQAQRQESEVPADLVDTLIDSEEFVGVMRRQHEALLWPNIDQVELVPGTHMLYPLDMPSGNQIWVSPLRSVFVRTIGGSNLFLPCRDAPAEFDANGNVVVQPFEQGGQVVAYLEGWVEVRPYWAPQTTVKVCALDALDSTRAAVCPGPAERYPFADPICDQFQAYADLVQAPFRNSDIECDSALSILSPGCGCGPNLQYCQTPETDAAIRQSLLEQELRLVEQNVREDRPYHEVLTTKRVEFNGPIAHYLRYQSRLSFDTFADEDATAPAPAGMTYTDFQWVPVDRGGRHSGVLTTPGYLLKFQSLRQRAHRFYNAFECSSFIPNGALPSPFEPCSQHEDLTKRCGCDACHQTLEPMAAHWGRFAEYGFANLSEEEFPRQVGGLCTPPFDDVLQLFRCYRFWELDPVGEEQPYFGMLNAYVFRSNEGIRNIEEGPTRLVQASLESGRFGDCTTRRMWTQLMRREPTLDEELDVLPLLRNEFEQHQSLKALARSIVTHPAYRRAP